MAATSDEAKENVKIRDRERYLDPKRKRWKLNHDLMKKYGITADEYDSISKSQGHVCAICKCAQVESKVAKRLVVDHCHQTGEVRGLLCTNCNFMLGHSRDNVEILKNAIEYLTVPYFAK